MFEPRGGLEHRKNAYSSPGGGLEHCKNACSSHEGLEHRNMHACCSIFGNRVNMHRCKKHCLEPYVNAHVQTSFRTAVGAGSVLALNLRAQGPNWGMLDLRSGPHTGACLFSA